MKWTWRRRVWGVLAAVVVGLVPVACGSDGGGTAKAPAGAKEDAAGAAVCYDWPDGTVAKDCAVDLKGPGGGRVFYDAGSVQSWGRFLEVAPQSWNGTLYACPGELFGSSCGAADGVPEATGDYGPNAKGNTSKAGDGYWICGQDTTVTNVNGWTTGAALGDGLANTDTFSNDPRCNNGVTSAVTLTRGYRGGGLTDWYLPSEAELVALCHYGGRNAIGGFPGSEYYVSSTATYNDNPVVGGTWKYRTFAPDTCDNAKAGLGGTHNSVVLVRPIRAF